MVSFKPHNWQLGQRALSCGLVQLGGHVGVGGGGGGGGGGSGSSCG